jgi:hypothetical protein
MAELTPDAKAAAPSGEHQLPQAHETVATKHTLEEHAATQLLLGEVQKEAIRNYHLSQPKEGQVQIASDDPEAPKTATAQGKPIGNTITTDTTISGDLSILYLRHAAGSGGVAVDTEKSPQGTPIMETILSPGAGPKSITDGKGNQFVYSEADYGNANDTTRVINYGRVVDQNKVAYLGSVTDHEVAHPDGTLDLTIDIHPANGEASAAPLKITAPHED